MSVVFVSHCNLVDLSTKIVGPKEDTGFTSAYNVEPITFKPNEAHDGKLPVCGILSVVRSALIFNIRYTLFYSTPCDRIR